MTTDFIQDKYLGKWPRSVLFGEKPTVRSGYTATENKIRTTKLELTRDAKFLNGADDIFDVLNRAGDALQEAEDSIQEKDDQIQYLEDISGIDLVTGFLNRRGFTKALIREVSRTNRGHNEGGLLVMFNLENFDNIREKHGMDAAERALILVAKAMDNEIRPIDWAGRINDDEFVLLFSHTTMEEALDRLQNMALRLNKLSLIWAGAEIHLSLSLGLKSYGRGDRAEDIFRCANDDLQRNRKGAPSK